MKPAAGLLPFLAVVTTAAVAEPPTGSRLGDVRDKAISVANASGASAMHNMASCLYAKRGPLVRAMLDSKDGKEIDRISGQLSASVTCLAMIATTDGADSTTLSYPRDIYRGSLAEAVLGKMDAAMSGLAALPPQPAVMLDWFALTGRDPVVDSMAVCVTESNPQGVAALLRSRDETDAEKAALRGLAPSLGPCLLTGATLKANRQSLRAALAEAMYHRVTAPPAGSAMQ